MTATPSQLRELLERYDAALKDCPVNNPKQPGAITTCPRCRATASQSCGEEDGASYAFIKGARDALPHHLELEAETTRLRAEVAVMREALERIRYLRPAGNIETARNTRKIVMEMEILAGSALTQAGERA